MKSDWKNCILGDCLQIVKTSVMPKEQTMYSCFSLPAFDNSRTPEILDGKDIKSSKFVLTENTILFNKLNPKFRRIWNVHSLDQTINPIATTEFLPLKVNSNISQDFLYYYISSPSFTALMDGIKTGTSNSQQRIDWRLFLRQPIYLPPSHTQCKIARILTLIDDKIHLNQQINKNLEQQALAIFRQYFMDFAPYGGVAPSDWMEVSLDDVCIRITDGSHYSPADSPDSPYPMYSVKDMLTNEQVIEELLNLAKQMATANKEGEQLGLTADELAFYDALTKPQAIKDFYENTELIAITKELADTLRKNRTIDWQKRDSARAKMRMMIKRLLKRHRYPPEGMDDAVQTVMTQCELWTDNNDMESAYSNPKK